MMIFSGSHKGFTVMITLLFCGMMMSAASAQRRIVTHPEEYRSKGIASFYGTRFDGQLTSAGDVFDSKGMTAASNTLPLNTYVKVTNLRNGKWVVVRINDRMARHNKRLIDLTKAAASKLKMIKSGLAHVLVEAVPEEFYTFFSIVPEELLIASDPVQLKNLDI